MSTVIGVCTNYGCSDPATHLLEIPTVTQGLGPMRDPYCAEHARAILSEKSIFPGARDITAAQERTG